MSKNKRRNNDERLNRNRNDRDSRTKSPIRRNSSSSKKESKGGIVFPDGNSRRRKSADSDSGKMKYFYLRSHQYLLPN